MKNKYVVATGIVLFRVNAPTPVAAMETLKRRIRERGERPDRHDPLIGMSLANALREGQLNFVVLTEDHKQALCGEFDGKFIPRVSTEQLAQFRRHLPGGLFDAPTLIETEIE